MLIWLWMDTTRAQGILGFTSNRWMDTSAGGDPKDVLDKALAAQMQKLSTKKGTKDKVRNTIISFGSFGATGKCDRLAD